MDFTDQLQAIAKRIEKQNATITTDEEIKKAYVIPFIQVLGYDVFDPKEVLPNFASDAGCTKSEKVDYAIFIDDIPTLLFECTSSDCELNEAHAVQLRRCFHVASAQVGVLTNGKLYHFYSDLDKPYVMDAEPFMKFNLLSIDERSNSELRKLSKRSLQSDQIFSVAKQINSIRAIKNILVEQSISPSMECIRFLARQSHLGILTRHTPDRLAPIIKEAFRQFVEDSNTNNGLVKQSHNDVIFTDEEFEGFFVVDVT
jgi:predicted type IV restriction endonuclease